MNNVRLISFLVAVWVLITGCCSIYIQNTKLSCSETCTDERAGFLGCARCKPDGYNQITFNRPRPPVEVDKASKYLGRLFLPRDYQNPKPCIPENYKIHNPTSLYSDSKTPADGFSYFYYSFTNSLKLDVVNDIELKASVEETLKANLQIPNLSDRAKLAQNLSVSIATKLMEKKFTKGVFQIVTLSPDLVNELDSKEADKPSHPLNACKNLLREHPDASFIYSIALITSSGSLSKESLSELNAIIEGELTNAKIQNVGDLSAKVSVSVRQTLTRKLSTETANHASIYGYGFWSLSEKYSPAVRVEALKKFKIQNKAIIE